MRGGRPILILGAGIAAAVLVAMMSGGKQASAPVVVELAMPPGAKPTCRGGAEPAAK